MSALPFAAVVQTIASALNAKYATLATIIGSLIIELATTVLKETPSLHRKPFVSDVFTVIVGQNQKKYQLHKNALMKESGYFKKLFAAEMKESKTKTVTLDSEVDEEIAFDKFIQYAYLNDYATNEDDIRGFPYLRPKLWEIAETGFTKDRKLDGISK
ncbi:hypothetical protein ABW20_dc0104856 [Dactylellina cionopaga]|nr:hypothetical protein ABW20_dc0104856 [Dactylellina cionopaga]